MAGRVAVVTVALDPGREAVHRFVQATGLTVRVLLDGKGEVAAAYRIRAIPTLAVIDGQGLLRYRHEGYPGTATLARELEGLLGEAGT